MWDEKQRTCVERILNKFLEMMQFSSFAIFKFEIPVLCLYHIYEGTRTEEKVCDTGYWYRMAYILYTFLSGMEF